MSSSVEGGGGGGGSGFDMAGNSPLMAVMSNILYEGEEEEDSDDSDEGGVAVCSERDSRIVKILNCLYLLGGSGTSSPDPLNTTSPDPLNTPSQCAPPPGNTEGAGGTGGG